MSDTGQNSDNDTHFIVRVPVTQETKRKLKDAAKEAGTTLAEYVRPLLYSLSRGDIQYKVIDNRGKKS